MKDRDGAKRHLSRSRGSRPRSRLPEARKPWVASLSKPPTVAAHCLFSARGSSIVFFQPEVPCDEHVHQFCGLVGEVHRQNSKANLSAAARRPVP